MENNKAKKFKWKISIFDIIIIAVVIVAAFLFLKLTNRGNTTVITNTTSTTIKYKVELDYMIPGAAEMIQVGDELNDGTTNVYIGKVLSVDVAPTTASVKNNNTGEFFIQEVPEKYTATIMIEAPAEITDQTITVNSSYLIRVGKSARVRGPGYAGTGSIIGIDRGDWE